MSEGVAGDPAAVALILELRESGWLDAGEARALEADRDALLAMLQSVLPHVPAPRRPAGAARVARRSDLVAIQSMATFVRRYRSGHHRCRRPPNGERSLDRRCPLCRAADVALVGLA